MTYEQKEKLKECLKKSTINALNHSIVNAVYSVLVREKQREGYKALINGEITVGEAKEFLETYK